MIYYNCYTFFYFGEWCELIRIKVTKLKLMKSFLNWIKILIKKKKKGVDILKHKNHQNINLIFGCWNNKWTTENSGKIIINSIHGVHRISKNVLLIRVIRRKTTFCKLYFTN